MKQRFTIQVERFEKIPVAPPARGFTSRSLGFFEETVELEIDVERIARILGRKAVGNKSGKAVDLNGDVVVRHIRKKASS